MLEPLFFEPIFKERIWGGEELKNLFDYEIPNDKTGECWGVSAHPNGQSIIKNGIYNGKTLGELWKHNRELFGNVQGDKFPLLVKLLDANLDLSVQVHPDDEYAKENENGELGKTECWYVVDCKKDATIVYGHNAKTKDELIAMIKENKWNELLRTISIKTGDFIYVPSGTIHALKAGTVVLEVQQSSDTTYRLYDYDRRDQNGELRELHIEKAIEVIKYPHQDSKIDPEIIKRGNLTITSFVDNEFFAVSKWVIDGKSLITTNKPFLLVNVLKGQGELIKDDRKFDFKKGDHLMLPSGFGKFEMVGQIEMIVSSI